MCAPSPPPAPDYTGAAVAQGAANKEAAISQARLNNPNIIGPYGTQTFTENGDDGRPTLTQTLSPDQQRLLNQSNQVKNLLGGVGIQGAQSLGSVVGTKVNFDEAPQVGGYDDTRSRVLNAMMSRADEDYGKQTDQTHSELIAAGIRPGTKAYGDRMQMIERSRNDARTQAELAAGAETSRAFGTDTQARKDFIAELLAQRQTPINEINALMSGSQVSNPFAMPGVAQNANVAPAPIFGATQAQDQAATGLYNADAGRSASTTNAALGIGAAAMMMF